MQSGEEARSNSKGGEICDFAGYFSFLFGEIVDLETCRCAGLP